MQAEPWHATCVCLSDTGESRESHCDGWQVPVPSTGLWSWLTEEKMNANLFYGEHSTVVEAVNLDDEIAHCMRH